MMQFVYINLFFLGVVMRRGVKEIFGQSNAQVFLLSAIFSFMVVSLGAWLLFVYFKLTATEAAAWVQGFGAIGAVSGAIWISRNETRQTLARGKIKENELQNKVEFEIANLAYDITVFLTSIANTEEIDCPRFVIDEYQFNELLERVTWVRRNAKKDQQLEDIRNLRSVFIDTTSVFRGKIYSLFPPSKSDHEKMKMGQIETDEMSKRLKGDRWKYADKSDN